MRKLIRSSRGARQIMYYIPRLKTELSPRNWQADANIEQFIQVVNLYIRWYNESES
jgi:hypothetical protein